MLNSVSLTESPKQLSVENPSPFLGCFRSYCELDLIEFRRIQDLLMNRKTIKKVDLMAIFSSLKRQSIFTIFEGKL